MDTTNLKRELKKLNLQYYAQLGFPYSHEYISQTVDLFLKFLNLPNEAKNHIDFKISPHHPKGELGYRKREASGDVYKDDKEFFHFHPLLFKPYKDFIAQNPVLYDFLSRANKLWQAVFEITVKIIEHFEESYPGCYTKIFNQEPPHIILRFLKYNWQSSGEYLAKPHYDSGSFTLALAESSPGLRIGSMPDNLKLVTHGDNQGIFFVSSNYRKIIDSENLTPAWHDVIQLNKSQVGQSFSRWAVVAFIDGNNSASFA